MQHEDTDTLEEDIEKLIRKGVAGWAPLPGETIPGIVVPLGEKKILVERETGCIVLSDEGDPITSDDPVVFDRANKIDMGKYRAHVLDFEDHVTYMYLDCEGLVTVGLGHQIQKAENAMKMTFRYRNKPGDVDVADIKTAYNAVLNSGLKCKHHTRFETLAAIDSRIEFDLDLDLNEIEALFDEDVTGFLQLLGEDRYFPDFDTYPAGAQMGMLDLAYNMGVDGFFEGFPVFREALEFRNWIEVAEQSHRKEEIDGKTNETMARRNVIVRDWFLDAIEDEPFFINTGCPYKSLSMIAG